MNLLRSDQCSILELFNLSPDEVEEFEYQNIAGTAGLHVKLKRSNEPCPRCQCNQPEIKDYVVKRINYAASTDRECALYYHARRYKCPVCQKTYYEENPFVFHNQKISTMTVKNVLTDLKSPSETQVSVAKRYHISPTSVASIFDSHVEMPALPLTDRILLDECYAYSSENSKYVMMILDDHTKEPLDILPSRKKEYLLDYFKRKPYKERLQVKYVCTDMYDVFRQVIKQVFPAGCHITDRYHVSQELHRKMDRVRIRVMNRYAERDRIKKKNKELPKGESSDEYYLLKHFNWLLFKKSDAEDKHHRPLFAQDREKRDNSHFHKKLNYYDLLQKILQIDEELTRSYQLKEEFNEFYQSTAYKDANEALRTLIKHFRESGVAEMKMFADTLSNWFHEIVNSFIVIDYQYQVDRRDGAVTARKIHLNNAAIERKNGILKLIKKAGCGHTNWPRFRNRCLYVLRKDATFRLEPIDEPKARATHKKKGAESHD